MFKDVLVALDLEHGETTSRVLRAAKRIAEADYARLHLLNVIPAAPVIVSQYLPQGYEKLASENVDKDLQDLADGLELDADGVSCAVRFGVIYQEVLAQAREVCADLIVLGSHKPGISDYLIGSNAARVVQHATCSVFVVR